MNTKPEGFLPITKLPNNCSECLNMRNGMTSEGCQILTGRMPSFSTDHRPSHCPIRPVTAKKLRLLLNKDCNRNCIGCCNKDWDLDKLPICRDYTKYDEILLTGGEPMLYPERIITVIKQIRTENPSAKIILYTAMVNNLDIVLPYLDGITLTLHDKNDIEPFLNFERTATPLYMHNMSLRLNIFEEAGELSERLIWRWQIKDHMHWIKNCPLPENEEFMIWKGIGV